MSQLIDFSHLNITYMKTLKNNIKTALCVLLISASATLNVSAQDSTVKENTNETGIETLIQTRHYIFVPQTVSPLRGGMRQLTSYYDLKVSKDTIISSLPFFGRAFTAPINSTEAGINFTSSTFDYSVSNRKKGGWLISIKPKDVNNVQQLMLSVSETGFATLQVTSNNRDPISFTGYVKAFRYNN